MRQLDHKIFLFLSFWILLLASCAGSNESKSAAKETQGEQKSSKKVLVELNDLPKTASNYPYIHHRKNEGSKAVVGDEVAYHQIVMKNDTLLQSSFYFGAPRKIIMPPRDSVASPPPPSYDALLLMSPGDSMDPVSATC